MPVPEFQTLMLPVLQATADGEIAAPALRGRVATALGLSDEDLAERLPSGRQTTFTNRVAWANIFLQRAKLIEKARRGVHRISAEGRKVLGEGLDRIDMRFLERYPSYSEWRQQSRSGRRAAPGEPASSGAEAVDGAVPPEEQIDTSHRALIAALEADLLDRLRESSPPFFERVIVDPLIAMGYGGGREEMGQALGRASDGGIDGVIKEDALGTRLALSLDPQRVSLFAASGERL